MLSNTGYFLAEGFRGFWHNKVMSFASVIVVSISLFLLGSYYVLDQNLHSIEQQLQSMYEIQVFIDRNATQERVNQIGDEIKQIGNIKTIVYITKEQALEELRSNWPEGAPLLEGMGDENNPLRNSYRITVQDITKLEDTISRISVINDVQKIRNNKSALNLIVSASKFLKTTSFWSTIVFGTVALFLISNTIKLTMASRKREINILKYIGATNTFIRIPFLIEGLIIGLLGSSVAYLGLWQSYQALFMNLESFFAGDLHAVSFILLRTNLIILLSLSGPIVGAIASGWSVRRYSNV